MSRRRHSIRLKAGDVRMLRVYCGKRVFRLAIYDDDITVPLIQARLTAAERQALLGALARDK